MSTLTTKVDCFDTFYNSLIKDKRFYEADMTKSYLENVSELKHKAFLKNTCRCVFQRAEETFGQGYAEKLTELLVNGNITITQSEKYPYSEFRTLETNVYTLDYFNQYAFLKPCNKDGHINHIQFFSEIENLIVNQLKLGKAVNVMDFSISLGLYLQRALTLNNFGLAEVKGIQDRIKIFDQLILRFLHAFSVMATDNYQPVTLSILDKTAYKNLSSNRKFSQPANKLAETLNKGACMDYNNYMLSVKALLGAFYVIGKNKNYRTPNLRAYMACTDSRKVEFFKAVERNCNCLMSVVTDAFKNIPINKNTDVYSDECIEAINKCLKMSSVRRGKETLSKGEILNNLNKFIQVEVSDENKLEVIDKNLEELIFSEKYYPTCMEVVYYKPNKGINFVPPLSETTINCNYLSNNSKGLEDFKARLAEAYVDAQTINQLRRKIAKPRTKIIDNNPMLDRLNVRLENVDKDLFYTVYQVIEKQNKELKELYGDRFTFEILKTVMVNDKLL